MAELMQLDRAAALVGKSEVTLRRLIKAGKVPFQKEKTLTGFVYMVDPDHVRSFYQDREGSIFEGNSTIPLDEPEGEPVFIRYTTSQTQTRTQPVRVAVAGESGSPFEYWQKKAELYEEKYNQEVTKYSQAREELGVWRGRAEQAQGMLMKLLPAPSEVEIKNKPIIEQEAVRQAGNASILSAILITVLGVLLTAAVAVWVYIKLAGH